MSVPKNKGDIVKYIWRMIGSLLQILVWKEMKYELTDFSFLHIQEVKTLIRGVLYEEGITASVMLLNRHPGF